MQKDAELIAKCCELVEKSLQWGDSQHWTNQDFEALSEKIFARTQVNLSVSTLKRIWGKVRYESTPTLATLNALARYLEFESWRDFQVYHNSTVTARTTPPHPPAAETKTSPAEEPRATTERKPRFALVLMTSLALLVIVAAAFMIRGKTPDYSGTVFRGHQTSDDLPNSVIFDYDASSVDADSVFIQQNWDPRRRERVSVDGKQHTSIYFRPGYFQAKLVINNSIAREDTIFIKTKGWRGIVDANPTPAYLLETETRQPGVMGVTSELIRTKTNLGVFNDLWVNFYNVNEFHVPGNAFDFETTLRNSSLISESVCRRINVTLLTKGSAIMVPLSPPGCVSASDLLVPNGYLRGEENDLSKFGCDVGEFQTLQISNNENHFIVTLNGKELYQETVKYPVGDIAGIRIGFEGVGEIAQVRLSTRGRVVIDDNFRTPIE